jgi:CBS domain-containing protein
MRAKDIMTAPLIAVGPDTLAPEVARIMRERDIGAVGVVDGEGRLVGLITESDFVGIGRCVPFSLDLAPVVFGARAATPGEVERIYAMARALKAREFMTDKVTTVDENEELGVVVHRMLGQQRKHLPVLREGRPAGMIARHDLLKVLAADHP